MHELYSPSPGISSSLQEDRARRVAVPACYTFLVLFCYAILVCGGVAATTDTTVKITTTAVIAQSASVNPDFLDYQAVKSERIVTAAIEAREGKALGFIPSPVNLVHLKGKKIPRKALVAATDGMVGTADSGIVTAAGSFDLRTLNLVSPVKNQGSCGSCWAFGSIASLESTQLPLQLWDFSENNMKNTHGFDPAPCSGGNADMAAAYLSRWSGPVAEADDPYSVGGTVSPTGIAPRAQVQDIYYIPARSGPLDNDNIKTAVQTRGGMFSSIYYTSSSYSSANHAYYYGGTSGANHAITIVGWDDAYPASRFSTAAPGNGAFIVKNSWGSGWGENGYFYVSYYDTRIGRDNAVFTAVADGTYDHTYQYDTLGWVSSMGFGSNTAWFGNVYTASGNEQVNAVSFYTPQTDSSYEVSVYRNPSGGPVGGSPLAQESGVIPIPGYHTVTLDTPVPVSAGQKFSVVVRLQTPGYGYPIAVERPYSGYSSRATAHAGESWVSTTGSSWTDLTSYVANGNACLKAFTTDSGTTPPPTPSPTTPVPTPTPVPTTTVPTTPVPTPTPVPTTPVPTPTPVPTTPTPTPTQTPTPTPTPAPATLKADFSGTPVMGRNPLTVKFTDTSKGSPVSWQWTFGDGTSSTLKNPSHQYTKSGTYTVALTVRDAANARSTVSKTRYIWVWAL